MTPFDGPYFYHKFLLLSDPELWSDPSTWSNGIIPGIDGAVGENATILCGKRVFLDLEKVTLKFLRVQGILE